MIGRDGTVTDSEPLDVEMHVPVVITDGGPWAIHDQACAVCQERKAVIDLNTGHFQPCWRCQSIGWELVQRLPRWLRPWPAGWFRRRKAS